MKFTEGYWLLRDDMRHEYAAHAYDVEAIDGGMRVYAPTKVIRQRGDTLNQPVITVEFTAPDEGVIAVRAYHHEEYKRNMPVFEKTTNPQASEVEITEQEAVMTAGAMTVRVNRISWEYRIEAEGKMLTGGGWRSLGFVDAQRTPVTTSPGENYLQAAKAPRMMAELSLGAGECVYGLGERFTAFVKNGQQVESWNEDGGTSSAIAYKSIPFYMTNRGYGVLVDHTEHVSFEVASEKVERVGFSVEGEELRFLLFYGPTPKDVLNRYTKMTGRPALPPAWSYGLWLSTSFTTDYDEIKIQAMLNEMRERDIALSVFHFDCFWMREFNWCDFTWDERYFPDPAGMLRRIKEQGMKIDVWINPYIAQRSPLFKEAASKGYLLRRADGNGVRQLDLWQAGMGLVDFTNPKAYQWYQDQLEALIDMGVDCFKTDFGERIPVDVIYSGDQHPQGMHHYYTYLYNQCVFELLERRVGEAVLFARSATVGCQKFPVHWGGDCSASYPSMAETLRGGLSFALSGFSFWSHDIAGFEETATPDLYKRWVAFGLLSTHSRLHGSTSYRVPWLFDEEACEVLRFFTELKCRLMPYIYAKSVEAVQSGVSVMRPMMLEFPEDPATRYLDQQYMLGDCLLVAPVFSEDGVVDFYLPQGRWTHLLTGEALDGGRWYRKQFDYFSLPLYVRPNALLPVGNDAKRPDYDYADRVELHWYEPSEQELSVCTLVDINGEVKNEITAMQTAGKNELMLNRSIEKGLWIVRRNGKADTLGVLAEGITSLML